VSADVPDASDAPAVTGEAESTLPPDAAVAAASLTVEPDDRAPRDDADTEASVKGAAAAALGAATAVGGAVGGMFASRRMARAETKAAQAKADTAKPERSDEKSRLTVFGARKPAKPKPVVGGKPRPLRHCQKMASRHGSGLDKPKPNLRNPSIRLRPIQRLRRWPPPLTPRQSLWPTSLLRMLRTLSPRQLRPAEDRSFLRKKPRVSMPPPVCGKGPPEFLSFLAQRLATPVNPPAPDATFDFDADGLVVATPQGALTPDGILIIAGRPPLNPPTRPGTVAPDITPQDQLAAVVPETAEILPDTADGLVVIAGRPAIEPPTRPGSAA